MNPGQVPTKNRMCFIREDSCDSWLKDAFAARRKDQVAFPLCIKLPGFNHILSVTNMFGIILCREQMS